MKRGHNVTRVLSVPTYVKGVGSEGLGGVGERVNYYVEGDVDNLCHQLSVGACMCMITLGLPAKVVV